jgi:hypothetical protein
MDWMIRMKMSEINTEMWLRVEDGNGLRKVLSLHKYVKVRMLPANHISSIPRRIPFLSYERGVGWEERRMR